MFFKIIYKNLLVLHKIRHVYSAVHKFWSNFHQLVNIFIIIYRLLFHTTLTLRPIFKSTRQICSSILLSPKYFRCCWRPTPKSTLFFSAVFSTSLFDLEKCFNRAEIVSNVKSSWFGTSDCAVVTAFLNKKLSRRFLPRSLQHPCEPKKFLKAQDSSSASFHPQFCFLKQYFSNNLIISGGCRL